MRRGKTETAILERLKRLPYIAAQTDINRREYNAINKLVRDGVLTLVMRGFSHAAPKYSRDAFGQICGGGKSYRYVVAKIPKEWL